MLSSLSSISSICWHLSSFFFFFFNDTATTEIYTLSLHDALPISCAPLSDRTIAEAKRSKPKPQRDSITFSPENIVFVGLFTQAPHGRHAPRNDTPPRHAAGTPSSRASTSFFTSFSKKGVDGPDKPGHDSGEWFIVTDIRSAYFRDWGKYFKSGGAWSFLAGIRKPSALSI